MGDADAAVFILGSRGGAFAGLVILGSIFGAMAWAVSQILRRAAPDAQRVANLAGVALWVGLVAAFYVSSVAGFREIELHGSRVTIRYWRPAGYAIATSDIAAVREAVAFRGLTRLVVVDTSGRTFESVPADRSIVQAVTVALKRASRALRPPTALRS